MIDYDRLIKGGAAGRIYVSFDNVKVGKLIGQGEVDCITAWNVKKPNILIMDGDPTDNNATLFAQGYNGVLKPYLRQRHLRQGRRARRHVDAVGRGDHVRPAVHGAPEHQRRGHAQRRQRQRRHRRACRSSSIPPKTFPTTGQDASLSGLQNILKGYQCGTVYKPIYLEAQAAAAAALYLRAGQTPPAALVNGTTKDTDGQHRRPLGAAHPDVGHRRANMAATVVKDGAVKASDLCITAVAAACTAAGIS